MMAPCWRISFFRSERLPSLAGRFQRTQGKTKSVLNHGRRL